MEMVLKGKMQGSKRIRPAEAAQVSDVSEYEPESGRTGIVLELE